MATDRTLKLTTPSTVPHPALSSGEQKIFAPTPVLHRSNGNDNNFKFDLNDANIKVDDLTDNDDDDVFEDVIYQDWPDDTTKNTQTETADAIAHSEKTAANAECLNNLPRLTNKQRRQARAAAKQAQGQSAVAHEQKQAKSTPPLKINDSSTAEQCIQLGLQQMEAVDAATQVAAKQNLSAGITRIARLGHKTPNLSDEKIAAIVKLLHQEDDKETSTKEDLNTLYAKAREYESSNLGEAIKIYRRAICQYPLEIHLYKKYQVALSLAGDEVKSQSIAETSFWLMEHKGGENYFKELKQKFAATPDDPRRYTEVLYAAWEIFMRHMTRGNYTAAIPLFEEMTNLFIEFLGKQHARALNPPTTALNSVEMGRLVNMQHIFMHKEYIETKLSPLLKINSNQSEKQQGKIKAASTIFNGRLEAFRKKLGSLFSTATNPAQAPNPNPQKSIAPAPKTKAEKQAEIKARAEAEKLEKAKKDKAKADQKAENLKRDAEQKKAAADRREALAKAKKAAKDKADADRAAAVEIQRRAKEVTDVKIKADNDRKAQADAKRLADEQLEQKRQQAERGKKAAQKNAERRERKAKEAEAKLEAKTKTVIDSAVAKAIIEIEAEIPVKSDLQLNFATKIFGDKMIDLAQRLNTKIYIYGGFVRMAVEGELKQKTNLKGVDIDIMMPKSYDTCPQTLAESNHQISPSRVPADYDQSRKLLVRTYSNYKDKLNKKMHKGSICHNLKLAEEGLLAAAQDCDNTMSALFLEFYSKEVSPGKSITLARIFDPTKRGLKDLKENKINPVQGTLQENFKTDPIRILRHVKLAVSRNKDLPPDEICLIRQLTSTAEEFKRVNFSHLKEWQKKLTAFRTEQTERLEKKAYLNSPTFQLLCETEERLGKIVQELEKEENARKLQSDTHKQAEALKKLPPRPATDAQLPLSASPASTDSTNSNPTTVCLHSPPILPSPQFPAQPVQPALVKMVALSTEQQFYMHQQFQQFLYAQALQQQQLQQQPPLPPQLFPNQSAGVGMFPTPPPPMPPPHAMPPPQMNPGMLARGGMFGQPFLPMPPQMPMPQGPVPNFLPGNAQDPSAQ